jgi:hypothetical protein
MPNATARPAPRLSSRPRRFWQHLVKAIPLTVRHRTMFLEQVGPKQNALNTSQIQDTVNLNGQRSRSKISYSTHLKRMWLMIT